MTRIVSFVNFKGGVGKTTLCVELAASLVASRHLRVLIVDLDPQTNATLSLTTEQEWADHARTKGTLREFFAACHEQRPLDLSAIRYGYDKHEASRRGGALDLLPSHLELFGMDLELATRYGHANPVARVQLRKALSGLGGEYDVVFIDCPPNLYLLTQNALFASDAYVIVALAEYLSTIGLAHIQRAIERIFADVNRAIADLPGRPSFDAPRLLGIIFNRLRYAGHGTSGEESIMRQMRSTYGRLVFDHAVSQSTKIAERPQQRVPIAFSGYAADAQYERQIRDVAAELLERITRS